MAKKRKVFIAWRDKKYIRTLDGFIRGIEKKGGTVRFVKPNDGDSGFQDISLTEAREKIEKHNIVIEPQRGYDGNTECGWTNDITAHLFYYDGGIYDKPTRKLNP